MTDEYSEPSNIFDIKKDFENLLESRAWRMLAEAIQAQVDSMQQEILFGPVESDSDMYRIERLKGKLEGRLSLVATAQAMLENLELDYQMALNQKENKE